jgi:hypothetical protein
MLPCSASKAREQQQTNKQTKKSYEEDEYVKS